jgi:DNA-binding beta-propeller fold protein YncE
MVVVTDENLFRILEYGRLDHTPPNAAMTEPRRWIGGTETNTEMLCGVYIDPQTADVYAVNNDTQNWMPVFSRNAHGNAAPDRLLATPHRTWGIAVDEVRQELFLTVQDPAAVLAYRKMAAGAEAPRRILEGDETRLADPHGIAVDAKNRLLFVANHGSRQRYGGPAVPAPDFTTWEKWIDRPILRILPRVYLRGSGTFEPPSIAVYAADAHGNAPPLRVIQGPRTQLNWPGHLAIDPEAGELFVANDADHSILVFGAGDTGDVAPRRILKGPKTLVRNPIGVTLDLPNGELWVANMGNHSATVYPMKAAGDVAPLRVIRAAPAGKQALMIGNPGGVAYDSRRDQILVPN